MSTQPESAGVSEKMRQLNEFRHEYSDETANELVRGWLKELEAYKTRCRFLESHIEKLCLENTDWHHVRINGELVLIQQWGEFVIRGDAETPVVNQSNDTL